MVISTKIFLNPLNTHDEVFSDANAYVMICICKMFFIFGYNTVNSVCTAFSMVDVILSSVFIRVPLAYLLSIYVSEGLFGIVMASPIATFTSVVVSLIYLKLGRWRTCDV